VLTTRRHVHIQCDGIHHTRAHTHTHTHSAPAAARLGADYAAFKKSLLSEGLDSSALYRKFSPYYPLFTTLTLLTTLSFLLSLYFTTVGSVFYLNAGFLCALSLRLCMCWCARALRKHMVSYFLRSKVMGGGGIALIVTSLVCCWCARALLPSQSALLHQLLLKY